MALIEFENSPSTNTPINADNLNNNFGECYNIIESGSNSNGNYIKFSDGTMICYGRQAMTFSSTISYGNIYRGDAQTINLPATFIDTNYQRFISPLAPIHDSYSVDNDITTSTFKFFPVSYTSQGEDTRYISYFAIGKWK